MSRLAPKIEVLRALFARSGNQCAFEGCTQPLINSKNQFIGQVCHIEAASKGGERYNLKQTDEQRRDYKNLLLLCYPHHIETNDVNEYPASKLQNIKNLHEQRFEKSDFRIDESELRKLTYEMEKYWTDIDLLNKAHQAENEYAFGIDAGTSFISVMQTINEAIEAIEDVLYVLHMSDNSLPLDFTEFIKRKSINPSIFEDIPYTENVFELRNWEYHNIYAPNWIQRLKIDLTHISVKYYEEYLKTNSNDRVAQDYFEKSKEKLKNLAQQASHAD